MHLYCEVMFWMSVGYLPLPQDPDRPSVARPAEPPYHLRPHGMGVVHPLPLSWVSSGWHHSYRGLMSNLLFRNRKLPVSSTSVVRKFSNVRGIRAQTWALVDAEILPRAVSPGWLLIEAHERQCRCSYCHPSRGWLSLRFPRLRGWTVLTLGFLPRKRYYVRWTLPSFRQEPEVTQEPETTLEVEAPGEIRVWRIEVQEGEDPVWTSLK